MGDAEDFYSAGEFARGDGTIIFRGPASARITLKSGGERLLVTFDGEPAGEAFLQCFRDGLARGLVRPEQRALVDLTRFTGAADWSALFALRGLAPWEKGAGHSRVAYLFRDNSFGAMVKIVAAMFQHTRHRAFIDRASAIAWLETPGAA